MLQFRFYWVSKFMLYPFLRKTLHWSLAFLTYYSQHFSTPPTIFFQSIFEKTSTSGHTEYDWRHLWGQSGWERPNFAFVFEMIMIRGAIKWLNSLLSLIIGNNNLLRKQGISNWMSIRKKNVKPRVMHWSFRIVIN